MKGKRKKFRTPDTNLDSEGSGGENGRKGAAIGEYNDCNVASAVILEPK